MKDLLASRGFRLLFRFRRTGQATPDPKTRVAPDSAESEQPGFVTKIPIVVPLCAVVLATLVYFICWSVLP